MEYEKSNFQKMLEAGHFAVTAEIGPPMSSDAENVRGKAREIAGMVEAANVTDNQTAMVRMSSIAASYLSEQEGTECIVQMTMRDRNRIAMQSDLLGAWALGLKNLLVLSGDHQTFGNHVESKNVHDMDSIQFLKGIKRLQEEGIFIGGSTCKVPPKFFLGGTANPFADPKELQLIRLEKKIRAGAQFIQTQCIYDMDKFEAWMEKVRARGLHKQAYIQAGIMVNKSLKSIQMTQLVAGMDVPDYVVERFEKAEDKQACGVEFALELIEKIKKVEGISGLHIMAVGWEDIVPTIVERAGFLPRPVV